MTPTVIAIDFETYPIEGRPAFPPEPVGVAIRWPHQHRSYYFRWGHPSGNSHTKEQAVEQLQAAWDSGLGLLFHNAKFDLAVAVEKLGLDMPAWDRVHDTTFLAYLADPHSKTVGLKPLAEDLLGWEPEEQDAVAEWVGDNTKYLLKTYPEWREWNEKKGRYMNPGRIAKTKAGRWIFAVPGDIVAPYACGDTDRTVELFEHLYPIISENGMLPAYDRERALMPILYENERDGLRIDVEMLEEDVAYYDEVLDHVEAWLRKRLKASGLNFDNDQDVAAVFSERGIVRDEDWVLTGKSKQRSISKDNLPPEKYTDRQVAQAFGYRNRLATCLKMFMRPWLKEAKARGGVISCTWNQIHGEGGGTRTGRPSATRPNLLNISKNFEGRSDGYEHPEFLDIDPLPLVRRYVLADEGHVFLHRDFSGQEVRVFAHYEQGDLMRAYQADPGLDPHGWIKDMVLETVGKELERTRVKNCTFSRLYGGGVNAVFEQARCESKAEAKELIAAHDAALPGRQIVVDELERLHRQGEPFRTWGGRVYFCEPPFFWKEGNRWLTFEYKMINYLVQGSAADITKECIIAWYNHPDRDPRTRFLVTVYDEINISCPVDCWEEQMALLKRCMEDVELDVPMMTDGKVGERWGDLRAAA